MTDTRDETGLDDDARGAGPFPLFARWMADAEASEPNDPNAMAVATVGANGLPSVRMVLLKGWDEGGFVFYTNLESRKGRQISENGNVALLFHWKGLRRQVRIEGEAVPVTDFEADAYFASRPRDSQIGAWASRQSRPLAGRFELEAEVARHALRFGISKVPRPAHWSGFRVVPRRIEFWRDRPFRLHDRLVFERASVELDWATEKLFP